MNVVIRKIEPDTDISSLLMQKLDWDVVVPVRLDKNNLSSTKNEDLLFRMEEILCNAEYYRRKGVIIQRGSDLYYNRPYQVVCIKDYVHTIGGKYGHNDLWMYPLDEAPCYENMSPYDMDFPVAWGLRLDPYPRLSRSNQARYMSGNVMITRNTRDFMPIGGIGENAVMKAMTTINELKNLGTIEVNNRDFDKELVGRKIWYREQPAIVDSFVWGQGCVMVKPDGKKRFDTPASCKGDDIMETFYDDETIKVSILSSSIYWFR